MVVDVLGMSVLLQRFVPIRLTYCILYTVVIIAEWLRYENKDGGMVYSVGDRGRSATFTR